MFNKKLLFIISFAVIIIVAAAAFLIGNKVSPTKRTSLDFVDVTDNAYIIYKKGEDLLSKGETDKAKNTFLVIINQHPDSKYAGEALKNVSSIYMEKGDQKRALQYYTRLENEYPWVEGTEKIRASIEDKNMQDMMSPAIGEGSIEYVVQPGNSLYRISRKYNTTIELIKKINGLEGDMIRVGQKLKVVNAKFSVFVDKAKNILILKKNGEYFKTYSISTGKNNSTPVGVFKVEEKLVKPLWYSVGAVVSPDSEDYELGARWMGISAQGYGIHGTKDESTIGQQVTLGCVRMKNDEVVELFDIIPSGTEVEIVDSLEDKIEADKIKKAEQEDKVETESLEADYSTALGPEEVS